MRTSLELAAANVRGQGRRLVSVLLAIVLAVAFVAATLVLGDTFCQTMIRDAAGQVKDAAVVVTTDGPDGPRVPTALATQVERALPGTRVRPVAAGQVLQDLGGRKGFLQLQGTPELSATTTLASGRLPRARGEVALAEATARSRDVSVGQQVRLAPMGEGAPVTATVVGLLRPGTDAVASTQVPLAFAAVEDVWAWTGAKGYDSVFVDPAAGADVDAEQARATVAALPGARGLTVRTGAQERDERVSMMMQGTTILTSVLMTFAVIAAFVAALVIANTFAILVAQRTRQLALLRCVGAERSQVRGAVLAEALLVSVVGSVLGTALGVGLAAAVVRLSHGSPMDLGALSVTPVALLVPVAAGVLVTLVASLSPARAATRVSPLAALRPEPPARGRRVRAVRVGLGLVAALGGAVLLWLGATRHSLGLGIPGGLASFVGVLVLGPVLVPALARVVGALPARLGGVPGELAVDNSRRNPARAAATASALLVGVTLITMMSVAAATATGSIDAQLDTKLPVDAVVTSSKGLTEGDLGVLRRSGATTSATLVTRTEAVVARDGRPVPEQGLTAVAPEITRVSRHPRAFAGLADGVVLLPASSGVRSGDAVTVTRAGTALTLRADVREGHLGSPVVTRATMQRLDPGAKGAVWARLDPTVDTQVTAERLAEAARPIPGAEVTSVVAQRAEMERAMGTTLMVVTGLLAIAVLIALVGIGNTLGLAVLERTQESGLLRALGLERGQLRRMLGLEALTLAAVGTVLGLALGVGYGIAGAHAALGAELPVVAQVPWARLALVAAVAIASGWLASVVPGRRASRVSPAAALSTD